MRLVIKCLLINHRDVILKSHIAYSCLHVTLVVKSHIFINYNTHAKQWVPLCCGGTLPRISLLGTIWPNVLKGISHCNKILWLIPLMIALIWRILFYLKWLLGASLTLKPNILDRWFFSLYLNNSPLIRNLLVCLFVALRFQFWTFGFLPMLSRLSIHIIISSFSE